jgi:PAS domain S-box-containing protein
MFGIKVEDALNRPITNLIPEEFRAGHRQHIELFRATGVTGRRMGALGAISGLRSNGETFRIEASISQANVDGRWLATVILRDITERLANEEARLLLSREVDHRAKNALAVVQAIVKLTKAPTTEAYVDALTGRIDSLARAHSLLAKGNWKGSDLAHVVAEETSGFQHVGQVRYDGPDVTLAAKSVQPLSLLIHELATNAVKHGALSSDGGTVSISWKVASDRSLLLRWSELGGPQVVAPQRLGFGSSLIETLSSQLRARSASNWLASGLEFQILLPSDAYSVRSNAAREDGVENPYPAQEPRLARRVLVVEDEAIVALALTSALKSEGWEPIGPAATIEDAYQLLGETQPPDVAILDINLDGVPIYPLAQILQARDIPFIFYSGYSNPALDSRFQNVPLIGKPARVHTINSELHRLVDEVSYH